MRARLRRMGGGGREEQLPGGEGREGGRRRNSPPSSFSCGDASRGRPFSFVRSLTSMRGGRTG